MKLLLLIALTTLAVTQDWQASGQGQGGFYGEVGNNSAPNLPKVRMDIDDLIESGNGAIELATELSNRFNGYWDEAWNVMVAEVEGASNDIVFYAEDIYRYHWVWINGYRGKSFVIWKDWNGVVWHSFDSGNATQFSPNEGFIDSMLATVLPGVMNAFPVKPDIWSLCKKIKEQLDVYTQIVSFTKHAVIGHFADAGVRRFALRYKSIPEAGWFYRSLPLIDNAGTSYQAPVFMFEAQGEPFI